MSVQTVPCGICTKETTMTATKRCDSCWELERRIQNSRLIAIKILFEQLPDSGANVTLDCPHTEDALDALDAAFFTGDAFHSEDGVKRAQHFLARWSREVEGIKDQLASESAESAKD